MEKKEISKTTSSVQDDFPGCVWRCQAKNSCDIQVRRHHGTASPNKAFSLLLGYLILRRLRLFQQPGQLAAQHIGRVWMKVIVVCLVAFIQFLHPPFIYQVIDDDSFLNRELACFSQVLKAS